MVVQLVLELLREVYEQTPHVFSKRMLLLETMDTATATFVNAPHPLQIMDILVK